MPPTAAFDAIRDHEARRAEVSPGVQTKHVVERGNDRLHGDTRQLADSTIDAGAALSVRLGAGARASSRVLTAVMGPGFGLQLRERDR